MTPTAGLVVADRFRLILPLGQGGMGSVWLAQHTQLDIPCAVKFIHAEGAGSAEIRARFEREAKAAAQLRTPHVVQILDHGVWDEMPYIAMEVLEGEDLAVRLARVGRLDARSTVAIVAQVARALIKAQGAGIVHRDLKPANIFLVRDDDREITKVLDFGVAKRSQADAGSNTRTGSLVGTPSYMSPEQAQGTKAVDFRSDLWALAVVVFECVTGALPFEGEAFGDLLLKIMVEPLPVPSRVAAVPPGFDAWWSRAASRDADDRFQSAKEFVEALATALGVPALGDIGAAVSTETAIASLETAAAPAARLDSSATQVAQSGFSHTWGAKTPGPVIAPAPRALGKRGGKRPGWLSMSIIAVVVLGGVIFFATLGRSKSGPSGAAASGTVPSSVAAAEASSGGRAAASPDVPRATVTVGTAMPEPAAASASSASATASKPSAAKAPPKPISAPPNCDPPYTIGLDGNRHHKPECP